MFAKIQFLLLICLVSAPASAAVMHSLGVARDAREDTLRYIEHHQYLENGQHLIRYYDHNLELIAYKELAYPGLPQHPLIEQADLVSRTRIVTRIDNNTLIMDRSTDSGTESVELPLTENIILDAGFDAFIRNNWDQLLNNAEHSMRFAVAGQKQLLTVRISAEPDGESGAHFRIVPESWIVRLFLPSLSLRYNNMKQLSSYEGLSNIKSNAGQSGAVHIRFNHYFNDQELTLPLKEWLTEVGINLDTEPRAGLLVAAGND